MPTSKKKTVKKAKKPPTQASETLKQALALFRNGKGWIKGMSTNETATAFCAVGAINRIDGPAEAEAVRFLVNALPENTNGIFAYNDRMITTFDDIKSLFKKAIKEAKEAEENEKA